MIPVDTIIVHALGYVASGFVFLAFCMKGMLSLRLISIASNLAFIFYALAADLTPILVLHGFLLPLNVMRLVQMQRQVRMASEAARTRPGEERFDWLIPLGNRRALPAGATIFSKGDYADSLVIVIEGEVLLPETGVTLGPGSIVGEIGLFSGDNRRTASVDAIGPVKFAEFTERRVQQLYFDNPDFAYKITRLITRRLVVHLQLLESQAEARAAEDAAAGSAAVECTQWPGPKISG